MPISLEVRGHLGYATATVHPSACKKIVHVKVKQRRAHRVTKRMINGFTETQSDVKTRNHLFCLEKLGELIQAHDIVVAFFFSNLIFFH